MKKLVVFLIILIFICTLTHFAKAQAPQENMKTFFDSELPGIKIQVNATAETQPTENITVMLNMKGLAHVDIKYFNLSIFGFLNGKDKILMANITDNDFSLNGVSRRYTALSKFRIKFGTYPTEK